MSQEKFDAVIVGHRFPAEETGEDRRHDANHPFAAFIHRNSVADSSFVRHTAMSGEHSELSSILKQKDLDREGETNRVLNPCSPLGQSKRSLDMLRQFAVQ